MNRQTGIITNGKTCTQKQKWTKKLTEEQTDRLTKGLIDRHKDKRKRQAK